MSSEKCYKQQIRLVNVFDESYTIVFYKKAYANSAVIQVTSLRSKKKTTDLIR